VKDACFTFHFYFSLPRNDYFGGFKDKCENETSVAAATDVSLSQFPLQPMK
jgi:hypothetical protein